ncbi:aldehyde ferredoxin oxidoreductase C-terminal domain-containing protein [Sedimenticola hydrogenitrophicus]|uniref:aldehyde ferredoxin oxidoreductase C-terminal domain-containing protein n=1 Tax=Sedimenticola hydrogenitrophicus TaxID=2967975 RepID=UPI0021A91FDE|nr:aldehyde ferredoxin oxidoreductase C-terminal domain-containing protein [Sedimenticola hydrogenitrophicus]
MSIRDRIDALLERMPDAPQYPTQGAVLFVDLERRSQRKAYLPKEVLTTFLSGRGGNMFLLYNLLSGDNVKPLDPEVPLIFGSGVFTGYMASATRGNVTSLSPESDAILDSNAGDYFPAFMRHHGYDHLVLYGRNPQWTLLKISFEEVQFLDATPYLGMDNLDITEAIQRDFERTERKDMALARITSAGENQVLSSGIMGGIKAIWARGGAGAKMGSLGLKAIMIDGAPGKIVSSREFKLGAKEISNKVIGTSVIHNALKTVGTPFLYKPSRILGAIGTKNNQENTWVEDLDADNFDVYRTGMDGCYKCPVKCRPLNDMTPGATGGFGANALKGVTGNASYDTAQAEVQHEHRAGYRGIKGNGVFDRYDKGDGPEYVTVGKFGPNIGIKEPEQVLRLNNILNDLGLDSSGTGGAIGWAMELYQRGIIDQTTTGGLDLSWGNYAVVEKLLFMLAKREGFGDVLADSSQAVATGKYPKEALDYRMTVKGLFQSDPHDSRILKAFALGLAVATRGMDHLRNRVTLEINARINDDAEFKTALYGGQVSAEPNQYSGKEYAVRRCEDTFAVGDSVGMCRFTTKLFNSPSLTGTEEFAVQLKLLTGIDMSSDDLLNSGRNVIAVERMINAIRGLGDVDDTLPRRWFEEPNSAGPFSGEKIDPQAFAELKLRFYEISGFEPDGLPGSDWWERLSQVLTGYSLKVQLPELPGVKRHSLVINRPVRNIQELRQRLISSLPQAAEALQDSSFGISINDQLVVASEQGLALHNGDQVSLVPMLAGG